MEDVDAATTNVSLKRSRKPVGRSDAHRLSTEFSPASARLFLEEKSPTNLENKFPEEGGERSSQPPTGPRKRMGSPPGRLSFRKSLEAVNRSLEIIVNEAREGKLRPQQANACIKGLNSVAANLRFAQRQERDAEEEQMMEQVKAVLEGYARLRAIAEGRGIIPAADRPLPRLGSGS